jgi:hypothetical protein
MLLGIHSPPSFPFPLHPPLNPSSFSQTVLHYSFALLFVCPTFRLLTLTPSAPRRISENKSHIGRGGSANIYNPTPEELETAKKDNAKWESAVADEVMEGEKKGERERTKGLAERGREWLFGKK